jgi:hypothetical protein
VSVAEGSAASQPRVRPKPLLMLVLMATCGAALAAAGIATISLAGASQDESATFFAAGVGSAFILAGLGLIGGGIANALRIRTEEAMRAEHPGSPWLWRKEWASGRIPDDGRRKTLHGLAVALLWNAFVWPIVVGLVRSTGLDASAELFFVGFFALMGVLILGGALHNLLRQRKFRRSYFAMATLPGRVGRPLQGSIETTISPELPGAPEVVSLRLACINKVSKQTGKGWRTSEVTRWEKETKVPFTGRPLTAEGGSVIPVSFDIPSWLPPTNEDDPLSEIFWRLEATAELPGVDYHTTWQVPVY